MDIRVLFYLPRTGLQVSPLGSNWEPAGQLHSKEPSIFVHVSSQPPLLVEHSSISDGRSILFSIIFA